MLFYDRKFRLYLFLSANAILIWHIFKLHSFENSTYDQLNYNKSHIAGLILARGGSKGIIYKNLAKLHNTTLLGNSLKIIAEFGKFNSIWVSTDSDDIVAEAKKFNANIHFRDAFTATDNAPSVLAVNEFIQKHEDIDIIGLIQCTSPFLRKEYLEKAFMLLREGYHSVFTKRPRRQDWDGEIYENGMFYFSYSKLIRTYGRLQNGRVGVVEIPNNESLEIDTPSDLIVANALTIHKCKSCLNHLSDHLRTSHEATSAQETGMKRNIG